MSFPPPHIHHPSAGHAHTHTVILLHGRGSTGPSFASELFEAHTSSGINLAAHFPGWRWVFPTSQTGLSTVFQEEMTEWFDIYSLGDPDARADELQVTGLRAAVPYVLGLVEQEAARLGEGRRKKVVLGGVSQGMATALMALLAAGTELGGLVGASGWLPFAAQIEPVVAGAEAEPRRALEEVVAFVRNKLAIESGSGSSAAADVVKLLATPVFLGHGTDDVWVDIKLGKRARDILERIGFEEAKAITWREYVGADEEGHWLKEVEEFDDIVAFLNGVMEITLSS